MKIKWFGEFSWTWWSCVLTVLVAGGVLLFRWFSYNIEGGEWSQSYSELYRQIRLFFGDGTNATLSQIALIAGFGAVTSILVGDRQKNAPCRKACQQSGWNSGRLRGNPHHSSMNSHRACWCCNGNQWSEEPMSEEELGKQ